MTRQQKINKSAIMRLRAWLLVGGVGHVLPNGRFSGAHRAPSDWGKGDARHRRAVEEATGAFLAAVCHDDGRPVITRAIRMVGNRRSNGVVSLGGAR